MTEKLIVLSFFRLTHDLFDDAGFAFGGDHLGLVVVGIGHLLMIDTKQVHDGGLEVVG